MQSLKCFRVLEKFPGVSKQVQVGFEHVLKFLTEDRMIHEEAEQSVIMSKQGSYDFLRGFFLLQFQVSIIVIEKVPGALSEVLQTDVVKEAIAVGLI